VERAVTSVGRLTESDTQLLK